MRPTKKLINNQPISKNEGAFSHCALVFFTKKPYKSGWIVKNSYKYIFYHPDTCTIKNKVILLYSFSWYWILR